MVCGINLPVEHSCCTRRLQGVHSQDPQAADVGEQTWHLACLDRTAQIHTPASTSCTSQAYLLPMHTLLGTEARCIPHVTTLPE